MDPVPIASAMSATSRTVFSVATLLYMFITSATVVDKSLEALYSEVNGLRGVLDTVENSLKNSPSTKAKDVSPQVELGRVWKVIGYAVRDTQRTVAALEKTMHALGPAAEAKGGLKKTVKQIQLNMSADDITNMRAHIHTH